MSTFNFNHQPLSLYIIVEWHFSSVLPLTPHLGLVFFFNRQVKVCLHLTTCLLVSCLTILIYIPDLL